MDTELIVFRRVAQALFDENEMSLTVHEDCYDWESADNTIQQLYIDVVKQALAIRLREDGFSNYIQAMLKEVNLTSWPDEQEHDVVLCIYEAFNDHGRTLLAGATVRPTETSTLAQQFTKIRR